MGEPTRENSYTVFCHTCDGKKTVEEEEYPDRNIVKARCPECNGQGWVYVKK